MRAARVRVLDHRDSLTIVGADRTVRRLEGDSAELARAVLEHFSLPSDRDRLLQHLAELSGPIEHPEVVHQLVDLLLAAGVLREVAPRAPMTKRGGRILLGLTGAAAAMHSPELVRRLQRRGHQVRIAATETALRFVTADALTALTHEPITTGFFDGPVIAPHIHLAEWADAVVIAPATATTIARIAAGDCSELVAAIAISTRAPVIVAPSMNPAMYSAPAVQRNLEQLRGDGFHLVHPQLAEELAHAPGERAPILGGAADADTIAELLELVLAGRLVDWDRLYRTTSAEQLHWYQESIDDDVARIVAEHPSALLLDVGTGLGSTAIGAARLGLRVVATDISAHALELARARAPELPITWLVDDITESRLHSSFDLVIDRGCLNVLPPSRVREYVQTIGRIAGSLLVLKTHEAVAHHFADRFELVESAPSAIARTPALLTVMRRI